MILFLIECEFFCCLDIRRLRIRRRFPLDITVEIVLVEENIDFHRVLIAYVSFPLSKSNSISCSSGVFIQQSQFRLNHDVKYHHCYIESRCCQLSWHQYRWSE